MDPESVRWDFPANEARPPVVRSLESDLQLFCDDWLIEEMEGISLRLHHPQPREIALTLDRPWEGPASGVGLSVLVDGGRHLMCYVGFTEGASGGPASPRATTAAASSAARCCGPTSRTTSCAGGPSTGIRASSRPSTPPSAPSGTRRGGHYVAYMRGCVPPGLRAIRRSLSTDFRNWSVPEFVDLGDAPREELYMSACTPYFRSPRTYVSFPNRYTRGRTAAEGAAREGLAETVFMCSRHGVRLNRHFMEVFIRPGPDPRNWYKHNMMVGTGVHAPGRRQGAVPPPRREPRPSVGAHPPGDAADRRFRLGQLLLRRRRAAHQAPDLRRRRAGDQLRHVGGGRPAHRGPDLGPAAARRVRPRGLRGDLGRRDRARRALAAAASGRWSRSPSG